MEYLEWQSHLWHVVGNLSLMPLNIQFTSTTPLFQLHDLEVNFWVWPGCFPCSSANRGGYFAPHMPRWISGWLRIPWNCVRHVICVWECPLFGGWELSRSLYSQRAPSKYAKHKGPNIHLCVSIRVSFYLSDWGQELCWFHLALFF